MTAPKIVVVPGYQYGIDHGSGYRYWMILDDCPHELYALYVREHWVWVWAEWERAESVVFDQEPRLIRRKLGPVEVVEP